MSRELFELLRELKLPSFVARHGELAAEAERAGWGFERFLRALAEAEIDQRHQKRLERLLKASKLPLEKSLATLDTARLPVPVRRMLPTLCDGGFVERAENLLAFGLPGRGKTHLVCAIGLELIQRGHTVHFTPTYALVQRLLAARRDLALEKELHRLDAFDVLILDLC